MPGAVSVCTPSFILPRVKQRGRREIFPPPFLDMGEGKGGGACLGLIVIQPYRAVQRSEPIFVSGTQGLGLLFGCERIDNRVQPPIEHLLKLMKRQIHAMIRDPRLREIVGPNSF